MKSREVKSHFTKYNSKSKVQNVIIATFVLPVFSIDGSINIAQIGIFHITNVTVVFLRRVPSLIEVTAHQLLCLSAVLRTAVGTQHAGSVVA